MRLWYCDLLSIKIFFDNLLVFQRLHQMKPETFYSTENIFKVMVTLDEIIKKHQFSVDFECE